MSTDIPAPPLPPRVIHAAPGQPIVLASDGRERVLSPHQAAALMHMAACELHLTRVEALDLPDISVFAIPRLAALRLVEALAAALASNLEAKSR